MKTRPKKYKWPEVAFTLPMAINFHLQRVAWSRIYGHTDVEAYRVKFSLIKISMPPSPRVAVDLPLSLRSPAEPPNSPHTRRDYLLRTHMWSLSPLGNSSRVYPLKICIWPQTPYRRTRFDHLSNKSTGNFGQPIETWLNHIVMNLLASKMATNPRTQ